MSTRRRRRFGAVLSLVLCSWFLGVSPDASAREKWGPFRGQVVDVETGQPISGAVILAVWMELHGIAFIGERFYEAHEAVTDTEGRFEIPRLSEGALSVQPPRFHLFAPGYAWHAELITPPEGERYVHPTVVRMRRLKTKEERRNAILHSSVPPAGVPHEKMPNLLRALNRELSGKETEPYSLGGAK